jgi:hypothetical protein
MLKHYNGNGENEIHFISSNRTITLTDDELKELDCYCGEIEDRLSYLRIRFRRLFDYTENLEIELQLLKNREVKLC